MRKLAVAVAFMLLLTGCSGNNSRSDVRKRVVVTAIGISENSISYQTFAPDDDSEIRVYTYDCDSLPEAEQNLALETGKEVFTGDVEIIVFSGNGNIGPMLDSLWHSPDIYMGTKVVFSETTAEKLLEMPSDELTGILAVALEQGVCQKMGLIDLYNAIYSAEESAAVPLFSSGVEISGEILLKSSSECGIIALYYE